MERRWSFVGAPWNRNKTRNETKNVDDMTQNKKPLTPVLSLPCLPTTPQPNERTYSRELFKDDNDSIDECSKSFGHGEEYVRISKSEYEAIKERVSAIESRISQEFGNLTETHSNYNLESENSIITEGLEKVLDVYEKTLEDTGPMIESATTTNQLANRLSKDLKIRNSLENKPIRSPSARKIGAARRKSRENIGITRLSRSQTWNNERISQNTTKPKIMSSSSMRREKLNTHNSQLHNIQTPKIKNPIVDVTEDIENIEWHNADDFFNGKEAQSFDNPCTPQNLLLNNTSDKNINFHTPMFVTNLSFGELSTPMLPPLLPPRRISGNFKTPSNLTIRNHLSAFHEQQLSGRESIARIRTQNAGMVMEKTKLFNGLSSIPNDIKNSKVSNEQNIQQNECTMPFSSPNINFTPRRQNISKSPGRINRHRQRALNMRSPLVIKSIKDECYNKKLSNESIKNHKNNRYSSPRIKKNLQINSPKIKTPSKDNLKRTPIKSTSSTRRSPRISVRVNK